MPIQINGSSNRVELFERIEAAEISLRRKLDPEATVTQDELTKLAAFLKEMNIWAREFDYKNVEANGFRCLLLAAIRLLEFANQNLDSTEYFNKDFETILITMNNISKTLNKLRLNIKDSSNILYPDADMLIDSVNDYANSVDELKALLQSFAGFETDAVTRFSYILTGAYLAANRVDTFKDFARCFYDSRFRAESMIALTQRLDIHVIKRIILWGEIWWVRKYLPWANHTFWPRTVHTINVTRQNQWLVKCSAKEQRIWLEQDGELTDDKPVRCRLMYQPSQDGQHEEKNGNLIIHVHGGGYVAGSPESHEVYTRGWANHLPGTAIVSVDYSLTPEARFPTPIQEILDVYLYLTSGSATELNFKPKTVCLVGDSCGAALIGGVLVVLNDIRRAGGQIMMPKEMVGFYSVFSNRNYEIAPSYYTSIFHPFLMPQVIVCLLNSYIPQVGEEVASDARDVEKKEPEDQSFLSKMVSKAGDLIKPYNWVWLYVDRESKPWFTQGRDRIAEKLNRARKFTDHQYLSPMYYEHLDEISREVNLTLIALDMDPTLDQSIAMAHRWKGQVDLDVVRDMPHAFLNFVSFGFKYWDGYYYAIDKMKKVMGYEPCFQSSYQY